MTNKPIKLVMVTKIMLNLLKKVLTPPPSPTCMDVGAALTARNLSLQQLPCTFMSLMHNISSIPKHNCNIIPVN